MKKILLNSILIIFIAILIFCFFNIYRQLNDNKKTNNIIENIKKELIISNDTEAGNTSSNTGINENKGLIPERNFEKLLEMNDETVAWISIIGTDIDYPVVQASDNSYYLNHSFDKSSNVNGWIYMNYKNNTNFEDQNTTIFGHNTNGATMFSELKKIYNGTYGNNIKIYIYLKNKTYIYNVVSTYLTESDDSTPISTFLSNDTLKNIISKSNIKFSDIELTENNKILTLSTCYNTTSQKIILHAVRE